MRRSCPKDVYEIIYRCGYDWFEEQYPDGITDSNEVSLRDVIDHVYTEASERNIKEWVQVCFIIGALSAYESTL